MHLFSTGQCFAFSLPHSSLRFYQETIVFFILRFDYCSLILRKEATFLLHCYVLRKFHNRTNFRLSLRWSCWDVTGLLNSYVKQRQPLICAQIILNFHFHVWFSHPEFLWIFTIFGIFKINISNDWMVNYTQYKMNFRNFLTFRLIPDEILIDFLKNHR